MTHSGIKDPSLFFCALIWTLFRPTCPSISSSIPPPGSPLHLSVLSLLTTSLPSSSFLVLVLMPCFVSLSLCCPFSSVSFSSACPPPSHFTHHSFCPSLAPLPSISSLSLYPLIHIHPLFYTLHDICLFIHLSFSLSFASSTHVSRLISPSSFSVFAPCICPLIPISCHSLPCFFLSF